MQPHWKTAKKQTNGENETLDIEDIDGGKKDYVLIRHPVLFKWRQQTYKNSNKSYQKGVHCNTWNDLTQ